MQHTQIIVHILLPPDQQTAEAVQPAMGPLHHPPPCPITRNGGLDLFFLASAADMGCISPGCYQFPYYWLVVAFVQTKMLWPNFRPLYYDSLQAGGHQLHVMAIGSIHHHPQRHSLTIGQQGAFGSGLTSVGGIRAGGRSPQEEPWLWLHPGPATPTQSPSRQHTQGVPLTTAAGRLQLAARVGSGHGRCWRHQTPEGELSIDSQCVAGKRCHPGPGGLLSRGVLLWCGALWRAIMAQYAPTVHLEYASPHQWQSSFLSWYHSFPGFTGTYNIPVLSCRIGSKYAQLEIVKEQ